MVSIDNRVLQPLVERSIDPVTDVETLQVSWTELAAVPSGVSLVAPPLLWADRVILPLEQRMLVIGDRPFNLATEAIPQPTVLDDHLIIAETSGRVRARPEVRIGAAFLVLGSSRRAVSGLFGYAPAEDDKFSAGDVRVQFQVRDRRSVGSPGCHRMAQVRLAHTAWLNSDACRGSSICDDGHFDGIWFWRTNPDRRRSF